MNKKGFLASLFDLSFSEFITVRLIKIVYVIFILVSALGALAILFGGFRTGSVFGVLGGIVGAAIAFIIYVLFARVWLELVIVIFRIAEDTRKLVAAKAPEAAPESGAAPEQS